MRHPAYSPSRRSNAPIIPGSKQRSASSSTESLYAAVKCRRLATARTSGSGAAGTADTPLAAEDAIIFSFLFSDIVRRRVESRRADE